MKKKLLTVFLGIIILFGFSSCQKAYTAQGTEYIKAAQQAYKSLDSAELTISDSNTGDVVTRFVFKYEGKILHYMYETISKGEIYKEYSDGESLQVQKSGEVTTYKFPNPKFKKYKRSGTHPNADTGIFFYEPKCIKTFDGSDLADGAVTIHEDGTSYLYDYDMKKLSKKMTTETTEGTMSAFTTEYFYDKENNFQKLVEVSTFEKNGETVTHSYTIEIGQRNQITQIVNPIQK